MGRTNEGRPPRGGRAAGSRHHRSRGDKSSEELRIVNRVGYLADRLVPALVKHEGVWTTVGCALEFAAAWRTEGRA
jgi:hypothetical protein